LHLVGDLFEMFISGFLSQKYMLLVRLHSIGRPIKTAISVRPFVLTQERVTIPDCLNGCWWNLVWKNLKTNCTSSYILVKIRQK
jgi:hypothetical protein